MLAFRILTTLLVRDGLLVKGKQFVNDRRIGSVLQAVNVFQRREIDEMSIVDISASTRGSIIDFNFIDTITADCFMPLAFGGGVKSLNDVRTLLEHGADKIIIGTHFSEELISEIAENLGSQSVTVAVDYIGDTVYTHSGAVECMESAEERCRRAVGSGCGEIILTPIALDGMMTGYDFKTLESVCKMNIPVIASGGAGCYGDLYRAYNCGASGVSAGAMYAFTQQTPNGAKAYLRERGVNTR
jgi:cyclase